MTRSIGVDLVQISEMKRLINLFGDTFINRTFTENEVCESRRSPDIAAYLSGRFAAKEAVFKAVAHFTEQKGFDFRIVETLSEADGYPMIHVSEKLQALLDEAGIGTLLVSLSTDGDYAIATVLAEGVVVPAFR